GVRSWSGSALPLFREWPDGCVDGGQLLGRVDLCRTPHCGPQSTRPGCGRAGWSLRLVVWRQLDVGHAQRLGYVVERLVGDQVCIAVIGSAVPDVSVGHELVVNRMRHGMIKQITGPERAV